jgi:hypothetical protein
MNPSARSSQEAKGASVPFVRARFLPMASAELSRRVEKVVRYPPLSELDDVQRREFHEALLEAGSFEDLSGKWQAAVLKAEENRLRLRVVSSD